MAAASKIQTQTQYTYIFININKNNKIFKQYFNASRKSNMFLYNLLSLSVSLSLCVKYKPTLLPSNPIHKPIKKYWQTNTRLAYKLDVYFGIQTRCKGSILMSNIINLRSSNDSHSSTLMFDDYLEDVYGKKYSNGVSLHHCEIFSLYILKINLCVKTFISSTNNIFSHKLLSPNSVK